MFLFQGQHLEHFIPKQIPKCTENETKEALKAISKKTSNCNQRRTCNSTRYTSTYKIQETWIGNKTALVVLFETPEVEYHNTYISYDFLSLIGEVGGILGLTLGASFLSLTESVFQHIPYY